MKRGEPRCLRVGIIGAGTLCERLLLPALSGPDVLAPPDDGAWWLRRPSSNVDIAFAPAFRVEVAALCDSDPARLKRVGEAARVPSLYTDWKRLVAEHASPQALGSAGSELDALFLALPPSRSDEILVALSTRRLHQAAAWLWLAGPPALSSQRARELSSLHAHRALWCARPLSQALAHRAARRMIDRGEVGLVRALALRWHTLLPRSASAPASPSASPSASVEARVFEGEVASIAAALDLLLEFAAPEAAREGSPLFERVVSRVHAHDNAGASVALIEFASGVGASLVLGSGDEWSAPLPRLEVVGTQGRFLVCEGGRDLRLHAPREAARSWSSPALAPSISGAEASGVAPDARAFLHALLQSRLPTRDPAAEESRAALRAHSLGRAALVLRLWEELAASSRPQAEQAEEAEVAEASPAAASSGPGDAASELSSGSEAAPQAGARARGALRRLAPEQGTLPLPFEME